MITSTSNGKVKNIIKCKKSARERRLQDVFLVEGIRMFAEIPNEMHVETYVTEDFVSKHMELFADRQYELVAGHVMEQISDTKTPQGVVSIVRRYHYTPDDICGLDSAIMPVGTCDPTGKKEKTDCRTDEKSHPVKSGNLRDKKEITRGDAQLPLIMALENLQDPGNLGTIIRTAEGAGVTGILMSRETVDVYNPKVVRATMGSIFRVPFCYVNDLSEYIRQLNRVGYATYSAHLQGKRFYDFSYDNPTVFCIGNEGNGLSEELSDATIYKIRIPMLGKVESLNAATAATVLIYEAMRQRSFI